MVHLLQEVPPGGGRTVLGAADVATALSVPVLPHVPTVRADPLPVPHRAPMLGHRLRCVGQNRGSRRPAVRARRPLHRRALRRLADVSHHAARPHRHAHGWNPLPERRAGPH